MIQGEHVGRALNSDTNAPSLKVSFLLVKLTTLNCVDIWSLVHWWSSNHALFKVSPYHSPCAIHMVDEPRCSTTAVFWLGAKV